MFQHSIPLKPLIYFTIALLSPFLLVVIATIINHFVDNSPIILSGRFTSQPEVDLLRRWNGIGKVHARLRRTALFAFFGGWGFFFLFSLELQ